MERLTKGELYGVDSSVTWQSKLSGSFPIFYIIIFFKFNEALLESSKTVPWVPDAFAKWLSRVANQLCRPIISTVFFWQFGSNFWNDGDTGLQIQPPSSIVNLNNREKQRKPESFISLKHAATKLEHFCWLVYFLTELLMEINWEDCENACQSRKISNNTSENALL
jgi:hypothetical protein